MSAVADKALAERLARLDKRADHDRDMGNALTDAYRSDQLITLAEAQAMVAAAWEAAAVIVEVNMLCGDSDGSEVLHPRTNPGNKTGLAYAAAIRAAATGTREGM